MTTPKFVWVFLFALILEDKIPVTLQCRNRGTQFGGFRSGAPFVAWGTEKPPCRSESDDEASHVSEEHHWNTQRNFDYHPRTTTTTTTRRPWTGVEETDSASSELYPSPSDRWPFRGWEELGRRDPYQFPSTRNGFNTDYIQSWASEEPVTEEPASSKSYPTPSDLWSFRKGDGIRGPYPFPSIGNGLNGDYIPSSASEDILSWTTGKPVTEKLVETHYSYTSTDTGSGSLGAFLSYNLNQMPAPTDRDHYKVYHYNHNRAEAPTQIEVLSQNSAICVGNNSLLCPSKTWTMCMTNGTIMCLVKPADLNRCSKYVWVECVRSDLRRSPQDTEIAVEIPCISSVTLHGNLTYQNNSVFAENAASNFASNTYETVFCATVIAEPAPKDFFKVWQERMSKLPRLDFSNGRIPSGAEMNRFLKVLQDMRR